MDVMKKKTRKELHDLTTSRDPKIASCARAELDRRNFYRGNLAAWITLVVGIVAVIVGIFCNRN